MCAVSSRAHKVFLDFSAKLKIKKKNSPMSFLLRAFSPASHDQSDFTETLSVLRVLTFCSGSRCDTPEVSTGAPCRRCSGYDGDGWFSW